MLRKLVLGLALAMSTALPLANVAEAAVGDGVVASHGASQLLPIEHVQYVYGGQTLLLVWQWLARSRDIIIADTPSAPASAGAAASAGTTGAAAAGAAAAAVGTAAVGMAAAGTAAAGTAVAAVGMAAVAAGTVAAAAFTAAVAAFMAAVFTAVVVVVVVDAESPHLA